jgi:RNA polymerase sigma factor (TIGR02999 family)
MSQADQTQQEHITRLLTAAGRGQRGAAKELLPLVYEELRRLAGRWMADIPPGQTLQATALVHEAYLRLVGKAGLEWESRSQFFAAAAQAMRDILVENARRKGRHKRGRGWKRVSLGEASDIGEGDGQPPAILEHQAELLALDEALTLLAARDERKGRIVMLRYFAGLTIDDTAKAMGLSVATVKRDWSFAKAWLYHRMSSAEVSPSRDSRRTHGGGDEPDTTD